MLSNIIVNNVNSCTAKGSPGGNQSPELSWTQAKAGTVSLPRRPGFPEECRGCRQPVWRSYRRICRRLFGLCSRHRTQLAGVGEFPSHRRDAVSSFDKGWTGLYSTAPPDIEKCRSRSCTGTVVLDIELQPREPLCYEAATPASRRPMAFSSRSALNQSS
jgi:hypothetical protein